MKLRAVHLKGHETLGDLSVSFVDEGQIAVMSALVGGCGAGKSFVMGLAALAWREAVRPGGGLRASGIRCRARVDFEVDGEVALVDIAPEGEMRSHPLLARKRDWATKSGMVLWYGRERFERQPYLGNAALNEATGSVCAVYPILADLQRGLRDSVLLIDDMDMGLGWADQRALWAELWRHAHLNGVQVIAGVRPSAKDLSGHMISLEREENPVEVAKALLSGAQKT